MSSKSPRSDPRWGGIPAWAQRHGHAFKRARGGDGFVIDGSFEGHAWRLEWGPSRREYIHAHELRMRMEMPAAAHPQMLLATRALLEWLRHDGAQHDARAAMDGAPVPAEVRWLRSVRDSDLVDLPHGVQEYFAATASDPQAAARCIDACLTRQLGLAGERLLQHDAPLVLMSLRGFVGLRAELASPDAERIAQAVALFESVARMALSASRRSAQPGRRVRTSGLRPHWWIPATGAVATAALAAAIWITERPADAATALPGTAALRVGDAVDEAPLEFAADEVVQPAPAKLPLVVEFSGPLVAPSTAVVRAKAPGTLLSLHVAEGSAVRSRQPLGTLEVAELSGRVAERSALLASARAQLAQAERTHASNERLAGENFISAAALRSSRAALESAQAQRLAAQAQLDTVRAGLRDAALVAPISGVVARRHAVPGEKLSPEQEVLTIVDLSRLEMAGTVSTRDVSRLSPGLPVELHIEGRPEPVAGTLARIAPVADAGTRAIGVSVELANPGQTLRAGQYAAARVLLSDAEPRLTVPLSAVDGSAGQEQVWVIEHGALRRRAVTTGRRDEAGSRVEVLQGLDASAQVLAMRFDGLREGAKAVVAPGSASTASLRP